MRFFFVPVVAMLAAGCAQKMSPLGGNSLPRIVLPRSSASAPAPAPGAMPSLLLGRGAAGAHGPYLASHADHALALAVAPGAGGALSWWAQPLDDRGDGAGAAQELGAAPAEVGLLSLRPGPGGGFVAVWSRKVEGGHTIEVRGLDASGAPRGKAAAVYQGADAPVWVDAAATPAGVHVFFTVMTPGGGRVHALEVNAAGEGKGATSVVLSGATSWHAVPTSKGSMVLAATAPGPGAPGGQLVAIPVGEGARPGGVEVVRGGPVLGGELDAVSVGDRVFVGWDERDALDLRVKIAALSPDGKALVAPKSALQSAGDQGLIGLSAGRNGGLLVSWDDLALGRDDGRWVRLSALPADLGASAAEGMVRYGLNDGSTPLAVATAGGYAALTLARACKAGEPCGQAPLWPTFVRLDASMTPQVQAPLLLDSGAPPEAAWGLYCGGQGCGALALDGQSSALAMRLEGAGDGGYTPAARRLGGGAPAVASLGSIWKGPRLADVTAAPVGDGWLAATVTDHAEGSEPPPLPADADRRGEADKDKAHQRNPKSIAARSAIVTVQPVGKESAGAPKTVSVRAMTSPGVALAADAQGKEACLAWVARDNGDPEVFLTKVDREGKRLAQQELTHARGDVLDVALAPVDDGWVVVWVDTRDGNGEVYAARVDAALRRKGPERRITTAPGDASELAVLVRGKTVVVAFSDSRGSPADGVGDVYLARLRADDASKLADEVRVAATPEHGRAIQLQPLGDEALLAWLEQPPPSEASTKAAQVFLSILDRDGGLRSLPEALPLGKPGPLSSLSAQCQGEKCRFVVGRPEGRQQWLSAFAWQRGQREVSLADLAPLFAGAAADVTPTQGASWVLVGDDASNGEGRLRRVDLRW